MKNSIIINNQLDEFKFIENKIFNLRQFKIKKTLFKNQLLTPKNKIN
jgi:hypothetical protein